MKKLLSLCSLVCICAGLLAQNPDYLQKKDFQNEKKKISESIIMVKKIVLIQDKILDSLSKKLDAQQMKIDAVSDSLLQKSDNIRQLNGVVAENQSKAEFYKVYFWVGLIISLVLFLIVFFYLTGKFKKLKLEFLETEKIFNERIESETKGLKEALIGQEEKNQALTRGLKLEITELKAILQHKETEHEQKHEAYAATVMEQFNTLSQSAELIDKSQKEAVRQIEESLKKRWAMVDIKLAEINEKLTE